MNRTTYQSACNTRQEKRILLVIVLLAASFVACAPGGKFVQKDFDSAIECLKVRDIPGALHRAEKLPDAEKARIRAYAYFVLQQYEAGIHELDKAIKSLQLRATVQAERDIQHLKHYKDKMREKQVLLKLQDTTESSTE